MPQTPDEMLSAVSESLAARTGRSLEQWLARLQPGGGPGQATHKVSLRAVREVDAEVVRLLRVAYRTKSLTRTVRRATGRSAPTLSATVTYAEGNHRAMFA